MKNTFSLLLLLLIFTESKSQSSNGLRESSIGFRVGYSLNNLNIEIRETSGFPINQLKTKSRFSALATFFYENNISENLGFQLNLGASKRTSDDVWYINSGNTYEYSRRYQIYTATFMPLLKPKLNIDKSFLLYALAGPRLEAIISHSEAFNNIAELPFDYPAEKGDLNTFVWGLTGGLGAEIKFERSSLFFEGAWYYTFNPIFEAQGPRRDNYGDEGFFIKIKDRMQLTISSGMSFQI